MKVLSREQFVETIKCSLFRNIIEQQLFSPPHPKTAFAVINQFCFVVVFNVSVVQDAPGRHNCRCRRSRLASPDDDGKLGASSSTFHRQPRLSINQGLWPPSPAFYHSDTDASVFAVEQTLSPRHPYTMHVLFPFDFIHK